jgi:uncharacterized protein YecT (DUF1311 family)
LLSEKRLQYEREDADNALTAGDRETAAADHFDCSDPVTTLEIKACTGREIERADAELNAHYKALVALLEKRGESGVVSGPGGEYEGTEYVRRTREAQRTWIKYRDAECEREALTMLSGTGERVIEMGCLARMTQERADELNKDLEWFRDH